MKKLFKNENGNVIVFFTLGVFMILTFVSIVVDVGCILSSKNQLQSAVDASALAAASGLALSESVATERALSISGSNSIMDQNLDLELDEITYLDEKTVQITAERTVTLFFSRAFGLNSATINATATAECGNRDIMLVFDRSGSMDDDTQNPSYPQPITSTKIAANYFVDLIESNLFVYDRIGLVSYSTYGELTMQLGRDFNQMKNIIQMYSADGYTNIGEAIRIASEELIHNQDGHSHKTIILLSDGMANRPGSGLPTNYAAITYAVGQAQAAANNSIKIYTISLGNSTDINLMNQIAALTNGKHYHAPTTSDLYSIFNKIADRIPSVLIG